MNKKNITVLIPVHRVDGDYKEMLLNALSSMETFHNDVNVSIICPTSVKKEIGQLSDKIEINILENKGKTDFCSQINLGIEKCETEWFTILEMDDEFKPVWLKSVNQYVNEYSDVDVFLPVVKDVNVDGKFLSFTNESTWAYGFVEKQGFLDNETLLDYQNYQTSGGLFKTQVIKDNGSLKENIKLTFSYELLLRLTHNGVKIMSIPRIGYQHVNFREDSLFWSYKNDESIKLDESEVKFWLETAKKEFFFKNKRDIKYEQA
jgi:hypothetical protein